MARTVSQIQQEINKNINANIPQLTNTSKFSVWYQISYVCAVAIAFLEQVFDLFRADTNKLIATIPPNSFLWLQDKILNLFQYDANNTQIIQLQTDITKSNYLQPYYVNVDTSLNIVKQCSLNLDSSVPGGIDVKAIGANRVNLNSAQINSLLYFLQIIGVPGITYFVSSYPADILIGQITINYNKNYNNGDIQTLFNNFFNAYILSIKFNGTFYLTDFISKLKSQNFVNDFTVNSLDVTNNNLVSYNLPIVVNNEVRNSGEFLQSFNTAGYFANNNPSGSIINSIVITTI